MERCVLKASTEALPAMRRSEFRRFGDPEKGDRRKEKEKEKGIITAHVTVEP